MRIWSLIFSLLLSHSILAKNLPDSIDITYDLSFEKKPLGSIDVKYRKDKSRYKIIASSNFLGAMNLLGNYQLISSGHIKGKHYFPDTIMRKNLKKNRQTITTIDYNTEVINIKSDKINCFILQFYKSYCLIFLYKVLSEIPSSFAANLRLLLFFSRDFLIISISLSCKDKDSSSSIVSIKS